MNNSYNNNNNNNNSSNSNNSNNDSNNSNNDSNNNDNNNNTDNDSLNNDRTNAEENSTYPNIEEELRQLKIRIDFSALKNNMESIINNSIASANSLDLKQSPNSQTSLTGSITLTNESHSIPSDETPLPLEDINTNITDSSNSNESDEAIEQEKKLIALASLTEENTTTTNQDASQINQTKPGKEVKTDYDLENEKKLIAASVENSQNKDEESAKNLKKVENSAELHIHAKASFHTTYFERKGEKVKSDVLIGWLSCVIKVYTTFQ
ncbi:hypothetical protein AC249_AIPGENE20634 [Exaiptasia diaphana]|nr:hypothetical protein AC249_AIPGENE20634 [Exaiptasia diaphana]